MKKIEIKAKLRTELGKKATKELRKQGMVPCNLYGGEKNINFYAHENEFTKIIYTPEVFEIELDIDGDKHRAIIQELQFHPVKDNVTHIDFLEVSDDKPVKNELPVKLEGVAVGVTQGGRMVLNLRRLKVRGLVKDMPEFLTINVEHLAIGKGVKVGELQFENLELLNAPNAVVCAVKMTRSARSAALAAAKSEGE